MAKEKKAKKAEAKAEVKVEPKVIDISKPKEGKFDEKFGDKIKPKFDASAKYGLK